jgi:cardiolipin synthase
VAARFLAGNRLALLRSGVEYFPALEAALVGARSAVFLETYIYSGDVTGLRITRVLCDAASRGVAVHVLVDGFGARDMPAGLVQDLHGAGARLLVFRPEIFPFPWRRERLRRMHRKLAVVDDRVAFVGGINIIDDGDTPGRQSPRYDFAAKIEGPLVGSVRREAETLWNRVALARLRPEWRVRVGGGPAPPARGGQRAALVVRDNFRHRRSIETTYLAAMESASREIIMASAYFFPGARFRRALVRAAARKVKVVLLLQERVEYLALHYATRALYGALLEAGVEIYEYRGFMHAKVAVIDGRWATVGSSNFDPFSLLLAREANLVVEDERFARELRGRLLDDIARSARVVSPIQWSRQPLWRRIPYWIGYGLARLMIGVFGPGGRF